MEREPIKKNPNKGIGRTARPFTEQERIQIKEWLDSGHKLAFIAKKTNRNPCSIYYEVALSRNTKFYNYVSQSRKAISARFTANQIPLFSSEELKEKTNCEQVPSKNIRDELTTSRLDSIENDIKTIFMQLEIIYEKVKNG